MSAECSKCGSDIVYPEGSWPVGRCEVCDLRAQVETLREAREPANLAYGYFVALVNHGGETAAAARKGRDHLRAALDRLAEGAPE